MIYVVSCDHLNDHSHLLSKAIFLSSQIRARDANVCRGDRYMLVTYDELTKSVKVG